MARGHAAVRLAAVLAILLAAASGAAAQPDPDVDEAGRVVMQQLEAFRRDDFQAAFGFASRTIHDMFDPARFEAMVRAGSPEIARSVRDLRITGADHRLE